MSGLREYISEAISSGKMKSSKYSLPEDISKITLDVLTDWLDNNGYSSVGGKLKPFSSIVDMYSGTPLYSVQIPIGGSPHFKALVACKDNNSFYIFYFEKGGAYLVRAVECDMYGDVLDDIKNVVYKRFVSSVNEAVSGGNKAISYNAIDSAPSSHKLNDVRKWLSGIGVPEFSGLPQELHFIVKMYNDTMELELWIPFSEKDEILYRFNYRSGELNWVLVREYKNHLGGNISDIPGNNKKQMYRVFSNIAEHVYNYLNKGVNEAISSGRFRSELPELGCTLEELTGWLDSKDATGYWWNDNHYLALPSKSSRKLNYLVGPWVKRDREQQWVMVTNCYDQRVRLNPNIDQECKFTSKEVKDGIVLSFDAAVKLVDQMLKNPENKFYIEDIRPLISEAISSGRTKSEKSVVPDNFKTKTVTDWFGDLGIPFNNSKVWSLRNWYYCMDPNSKSGNSLVVSFPITSRQSFIFRLYIDRSNDIYYCKQEFGDDVEYYDKDKLPEAFVKIHCHAGR